MMRGTHTGRRKAHCFTVCNTACKATSTCCSPRCMTFEAATAAAAELSRANLQLQQRLLMLCLLLQLLWCLLPSSPAAVAANVPVAPTVASVPVILLLQLIKLCLLQLCLLPDAVMQLCLMLHLQLCLMLHCALPAAAAIPVSIQEQPACQGACCCSISNNLVRADPANS